MTANKTDNRTADKTDNKTAMTVTEQARLGKEAWNTGIPTIDQRNRVLLRTADLLLARQQELLAANQQDQEQAASEGLPLPMQDRLLLTDARINAMVKGLREVTSLPDPLGIVQKDWTLPNGLHIERVSVPLGLVGIIYEARPNVTIEASSLIFKAGNAVILRGGQAAIKSNEFLTGLFQEALREENLDPHLVQHLEDSSREGSAELMRCNDYVDVLIPRGGQGLIQRVVNESRVPVIRTGEGNCHLFVDQAADPDMALSILLNGKLQRPSVCNAIETLLVHEQIADSFLPLAAKALAGQCELRIDEAAAAILGDQYPIATETDYATEYNDYILAVKVVPDLTEAMSHILKYGTEHSETIVTEDSEAAERFLNTVDAAVVYVNASPRFTDGGEFGFGGELGISTQKLHARGPMGLEALVSYKYKVHGTGQVR